MPESIEEDLKSFEEKLKSFLFDEKKSRKVDEHLAEWRKSLTASADTIHQKVVDAMGRNAEESLFDAIGEKIAETLNREGMLDFSNIKEKCQSVSRLSEELLQKHLDYAEKKGIIETCRQDGKTFYRIPKK